MDENQKYLSQYPKPVLEGVKDGANILITNVQYERSKKLDNGKYSSDKLYVVYRNMDNQKKNLQIIENPHSEIYTTKPEYMNDFKTQRDAYPLANLNKHDVLYRDKESILLKMLNQNLLSPEDRNLKDVISRAIELGKYSGRKEVHKWRHAYYSDYEIQEYVHTSALLHYSPKQFKLTKSFLDIEVDVYGRSKYDVESGACPVTAVNIVYDYDYKDIFNTNYKPKVFTFLLRDHKRYPQQREFEDNIDEFVNSAVHKEFDSQIGDADYYIKFYDDEALMLYDIFQTQHLMKPDFTEIWNMIFDIIYLMKRARYLNIPSEVLFCHPDFKSVQAEFKIDERYKNEFKNCGHNFNCLSYTKYADQMLTYAAKRKGGTDYGSSGIDNIGKIEVNYRKKKFNSKATTVINAAIREYYNFVLYSINDVLLQMKIERKVGDLDDVFMRAYDSGCRFDKANRMTVAIKTLWDISHFELGYAMGNNVNTDNISEYGQADVVVDEDTDIVSYEARLKGALVGNPTNLSRNGAEIFKGKKSDRLYFDVIDFDFAALYPNCKMVNNIAKASQYGRLIIPNKVSPLEYGVTPELRGGEFLDDFTTHDWIKVGIKWFSMKSTCEYIKEFEEYITNNKNVKIRPKKGYKYAFQAVWSKKMALLLDTLYPAYNNAHFIYKIFNRDCVDVDCLMYNNYDDVEYTGSLLSIVDFIEEEKPIITESGCFFKRPKDINDISPGLLTLSNLLDKRAKLKKLELEFEEKGAREAARSFNLAQNRVKRFANSEYGIGGAKSSFSYNYHVAQSVTSKGQTLISTAFTAFEDFLSDTITFYDTDELIHYMLNIMNEEIICADSYYLSKDIPVEDVKNRILKKCRNIVNFDDTVLDQLLDTCSQPVLNRLYYKSNFIDFISNNDMIEKLTARLDANTITFITRDDLNKAANKILDEIINVVLEYCHYNYHWYGRVDRLIRLNRSSVITIDTDSNIMTIHDSMVIFKKYMSKNIGFNLIANNDNPAISSKEQRHFKSVNVCASILTELIRRCLKKFEAATNVEDHLLGKYSMKNELYYIALLVNSGKKRYLGAIKLREGHYLRKGKRDVKGFDFIKSTYATDDVNNFIQDTLFNYIVTSNINISKALNNFIDLENMIRTSLKNGEFTYLTPTKVSTIDSYKEPMKTGAFKATYIWNALYPDKEIELPGIIYTIKLNISSAKDIAELAIDDREMFDKICALLKDKKMKKSEPTDGREYAPGYDIKKDKFAMNDITQIAIPMDTEEIPEWILKYADFDTMINKTMNLVIPILEEIGVVPVFKRKNEKQLSNIIEIG